MANNMNDLSVKITPEEYKTMTDKATPKPTILKNILFAFIIGGIICVIAQIIINFYTIYLELPRQTAQAAGTATMIFLGALLTGLGVYDNIGKYGGAGSIVPVTGFANSMVSPALEYKREGYVLGVGAKLFTVAGPILVYGITASILIGVVYLIIG